MCHLLIDISSSHANIHIQGEATSNWMLNINQFQSGDPKKVIGKHWQNAASDQGLQC